MPSFLKSFKARRFTRRYDSEEQFPGGTESLISWVHEPGHCDAPKYYFKLPRTSLNARHPFELCLYSNFHLPLCFLIKYSLQQCYKVTRFLLELSEIFNRTKYNFTSSQSHNTYLVICSCENFTTCNTSCLA